MSAHLNSGINRWLEVKKDEPMEGDGKMIVNITSEPNKNDAVDKSEDNETSTRVRLSMPFDEQVTFWETAVTLMQESSYGSRDGLLLCLIMAREARHAAAAEIKQKRKQLKHNSILQKLV